jgi:acid stress chaperone HdeB
MVRKLVIVTFGLMLVLTISAHAQMTIDLSTLTCEQVYKQKIGTARSVGFLLSGFYHGKRNDTVIDPSALKSNAAKLTTYCVKNPQTLIMEAVESIFGEKEKIRGKGETGEKGKMGKRGKK